LKMPGTFIFSNGLMIASVETRNPQLPYALSEHALSTDTPP